jgi:hypothetical protein
MLREIRSLKELVIVVNRLRLGLTQVVLSLVYDILIMLGILQSLVPLSYSCISCF